jgi:hypothetical protein
MSKIDNIFDKELSTTIRMQKSEAVGCTIYGLDRAKDAIKHQLQTLVEDHYWDSLEDDKAVIIKHFKAIVEIL